MLPHYLLNINVWKQAINDKLQDRVATYLRCGGIINNHVKKGLLLSVPVKKIKIGAYLAKLQARMWLSRALCVCLATTLLKEEESARHILPITVPNIQLF